MTTDIRTKVEQIMTRIRNAAAGADFAVTPFAVGSTEHLGILCERGPALRVSFVVGARRPGKTPVACRRVGGAEMSFDDAIAVMLNARVAS